jgi:DNA-binding MarR family transcriptional regulator
MVKEDRVLYKIKNLEKLVARNFIGNCNFKEGLELEQINVHPTPTQLQIIEYIINNYDKNIYQKDLEEVLKLRRATVSGVLQTMERNGLLERTINSDDARVKKIILKKRAREIFLEQDKKLRELEKIIIGDISREELEIFSKVLDKMQENLENIDNK